MIKQRYSAILITLVLAGGGLAISENSNAADTSAGAYSSGNTASGNTASDNSAASPSIGHGAEVGVAGMGSPPPAQIKTQTTARSGFLPQDLYAKLKPAPDREGIDLYVDRSRDYHNFTKVMFDPVEVYVVPNPEYKGMPREALMRMSGDFQRSFVKALTPGYAVVTTPGPDVLRVRMAITGVQPASRKLGPTDFIPIKAIYNVARKAAGASPQVAEMTAEFEAIAPDNTVVGAATATRKGDEHLQQGEQITWNDMQGIADYWAKSFRQRLDEVRGVTVTR